MQKRGFLLLLGVTMLFVAAAGYTLGRGNRDASPAASSERMFPDLSNQLSDLAWMRLSHGTGKIDFTAIGGHWVLVEKGNYPATQAKIRKTLLALSELTLIEPKTDRPELFARLDLDDPGGGKSTLVQLQDRTGKNVAELIVGKARHDRLGGGNDGVYIRMPGGAKPENNRAWLARGSLDLPTDPIDWLDRRILDIPEGRINSVTLTDADGTALVLKRDAAAGGKFIVADAPEDSKFKSDTVLGAPAGTLAHLDFEDVRPAADLAGAEKGAATAVLATFDGLTLDLKLMPQDNKDWAIVTVSGTGAREAEAKAINDKVAPWAFALPATRAKLLHTRLSDLIEPPKG